MFSKLPSHIDLENTKYILCLISPEAEIHLEQKDDRCIIAVATVLYPPLLDLRLLEYEAVHQSLANPETGVA
jgi:hypothetical protein